MEGSLRQMVLARLKDFEERLARRLSTYTLLRVSIKFRYFFRKDLPPEQ